MVKVLYLHGIRYFSLRKLGIAILYFVVMLIMGFIIIFFRLFDEVFFSSYRKIQIKVPVFIISNPRSGTTFLHRLMCTDEEKFVHIKMYHTIIPSITFFKLVHFLNGIDNRMGRPLGKLIQWIEKKLFKGWEDVHAAGFNRSEEDEGLYFLSGISPALSLITPYLKHFRELYILDQLDEKKKVRIKKYYYSTLQRWMYVLGKDKQFLCKSVMSIGRLQLLLEMFPGMRIVYLARNPYEAIPSFVEMFSSTWSAIGFKVPENSELSRELAALAIIYYQYFNEQKKKIHPAHLITLKYDDLVANPYAAVMKIYHQFDFKMCTEVEEKLQRESAISRSYKSKHHYSLEQYGLNKQEIYKELPFVFDEYGFSE